MTTDRIRLRSLVVPSAIGTILASAGLWVKPLAARVTLDKAFASLDDVPLRELEAIAAVLGRRRDVLARFSSVFRDVAFARRSGGEARLGRFHLPDCVSRGGDELADRPADAPAPFWRDMRDALGVHQDSFPEEGGLA